MVFWNRVDGIQCDSSHLFWTMAWRLLMPKFHALAQKEEAQELNQELTWAQKGLCCKFLTLRFWLSVTPWAVAHQDPLSMGFSRQEHLSGLACPPPGALPYPGIEPASLIVSCVGRWVLYHQCHLGNPHTKGNIPVIMAIKISSPCFVNVPCLFWMVHAPWAG